MNSFKRVKLPDNWLDTALVAARCKAKQDIFKQKIQANLIIGIALIAIFCIFYLWWLNEIDINNKCSRCDIIYNSVYFVVYWTT